MSINELFGTNEMNATANARALPGTAELTNVAQATAIKVMNAMEADIEAYRPRIQKSATDSSELDAILTEFGVDDVADESIAEDSTLRWLTDEQVDSMLKSQQSKRSRAKSKAMTLDNYATLMTAAIAERLLRVLYNKPKSAGGFHRAAGSVDYTIEQLEAFGADQEALRREIRNIQSKKSIMKSKIGFDESDERWQALLKAEQQLKDLRHSAAPVTIEVDTTKNALAEMLADKDISKMKSAEAHELLEAIRGMISAE